MIVLPYDTQTTRDSATLLIRDKTLDELLPLLRNGLSMMQSLQLTWLYNDVEVKIKAAAEAGIALEEYSPADWGAWGEMLRKLLEFLNTPVETLGGITPLAVLAKQYVPMPEKPAALTGGQST